MNYFFLKIKAIIMLTLAIISFLIAAVLGLTLLIPILQGKMPNQTARTFHGIFAAIGLILAIFFLLTSMTTWPTLLITGIVLLILAALGGLTMLMFDLQKKEIPKAIAII